jgi:DNA-binding transcriptional regulator YiaG
VTTIQKLRNETSLGSKAKKLRAAIFLTRPALAEMAGVSVEEVSLFERGQPVRLDARRRIMKALWAKKIEK